MATDSAFATLTVGQVPPTTLATPGPFTITAVCKNFGANPENVYIDIQSTELNSIAWGSGAHGVFGGAGSEVIIDTANDGGTAGTFGSHNFSADAIAPSGAYVHVNGIDGVNAFGTTGTCFARIQTSV